MESIGELREICQGPTRSTDCIHGLLYGRRISIYITRAFLHTSISANQVSLIFLFAGVLGAAFFAVGGPLFNFLGGLTMFLWYILDNVDGEVARYRKTTGVTGQYLDLIIHFIVHPLFFFGMGWGYYRATQKEVLLVLGFVLAIAQLLWRTHHMLLNNAVYSALEKSQCVVNFGRHAQGKQEASSQPVPPGAAVSAKLTGWLARPLYEKLDLLRQNALNIKGMTVLITMAATIDLLNATYRFTRYDVLLGLLLVLTACIILDMFVRYPRIVKARIPDRVYESFVRDRKEGDG